MDQIEKKYCYELIRFITKEDTNCEHCGKLIRKGFKVEWLSSSLSVGPYCCQEHAYKAFLQFVERERIRKIMLRRPT